MSTKKVNKLSDVEMRFIDLNWQEMTQEQMAVKLTVSVSIVQYYCRENGYIKVKKASVARPPRVKGHRHKGPQKEPVKRIPGVYSNVSSEQRVEYWLNYPI